MAEKEKQVPLSALLKVREENASLKSELRMAKANLGDEDAEKEVRQFLIDRDKELNDREAELRTLQEDLNSKQTSFNERERESRIQSLASQYAPSGEGTEIEKSKTEFMEALKKADDPEKEAYRLVNERLTKERASPNPAEGTFETTSVVGQIKKPIPAMSETEFAQYEQELKQKAIAK